MINNDNAALRAVVHGRVQGVGYRLFVVDTASRLGLTGFARNQSNGSVEVVAEGPQAGLDALLAELRRGPTLAGRPRRCVVGGVYRRLHRVRGALIMQA